MRTATRQTVGEPVLVVQDMGVVLGRTVVLDGLSLTMLRGEILGIVGATGGGKSVLLRTLLGLHEKRAGLIRLFSIDLDKASDADRLSLDMRIGVLFQQGALFSSLTVLENIQVPLRRYVALPRPLIDELAHLKLRLVGLEPGAAAKYPSELSGGMIKRAALARALALDPELLFLDEPTSGLDPIAAAEIDELVTKLKETMGLSIYMVTHDLDSLFSVCDRIAVLSEKKIVLEGPLSEIFRSDDPWVIAYFHGKRARQIARTHETEDRRFAT
jgi:phospholipid/cholesterol/gamma-HCH transport system ATP-binding protein